MTLALAYIFGYMISIVKIIKQSYQNRKYSKGMLSDKADSHSLSYETALEEMSLI